MTTKIIDRIVQLTQLSKNQVQNVLSLFDEGATIPFIARYRKEMTNGLDEIRIAEIQSIKKKLDDLLKRKTTILNAIEEAGKLSDKLKAQIEETWDENELEDLYLPFKTKRKTKATVAREMGFEGLAKMLMSQNNGDPIQMASRFASKARVDEEEALQGARYIIAEWVNEHQFARKRVRQLFERTALVSSKMVKGKEEEGAKFKDYFEFSEALKRVASHRYLAIHRGVDEGVLNMNIKPVEADALTTLESIFVKNNNESSDQVKLAVKDAYKRLMKPSLENECVKTAKEKADLDSIKVFSRNLEQLFMMAPLGGKRTLAIDPGFRTGCKLVCLDENGGLLHNENIYPHPPQNQSGKAAAKINALVNSFKIDAIAIGNGTAGRETEELIKKVRFSKDVQVFIVNEAGASIYSASKVAREEFPMYDVTVRGAVSIGRRLMDPMAELVKIEPKSIGVGQYQHDVNQTLLKEQLDQVVENCVNKVGVQLNTASKYLLTYVSGLGPQLAANIIQYRDEIGAFSSRSELLKVPKLGKKAFEQAAGFLRIQESEQPLDNSSVHPERYKLVEKIAKKKGVKVGELIGNKSVIEEIQWDEFVSDEIGMYTLNDIAKELQKPGRDPRKKAKVFEFAKGLKSIQDLNEGMVVPGIVNNITNFGAFVDIGIKESGLVHISALANEFISNPADFVSLGQEVQVKVISIDAARKRIGLSMKDVD